MRFIYSIGAIFLLLSCNDDGNKKDPISNSQYIVVNIFGGNGNLALYDYATDNTIRQFYTINSDAQSLIYGANKNGNYAYISTDYFTPGKLLRKIDLTTGQQVAVVKSWFYPAESQVPLIDFNNSDMIMCAKDLSYRLHVKRYNENLVLQDSLIENDVLRLDAIATSNDRLFVSVPMINAGNFDGYFIRVMDLNTGAFIKSVEVPAACYRLIPINNNQILVTQPGAFFILDTQTFEIVKTINASSARYNGAFNASENLLYYIGLTTSGTRLFKLNLSTDESSMMSSQQVSEPIVYDEKAKMIVCGQGSSSGGTTSGLVFFSEDGKRQRTVGMSFSNLFVK